MTETTETLTAEQAIALMHEECQRAVAGYSTARRAMLAALLDGTETISLRSAEPVVLAEMIAEHACTTRMEALDPGRALDLTRQRLEELRGDLVRELIDPQTHGAPEGFGFCPVEFPSLIGHVERELRCESCRRWIASLDRMIDWAGQAAKSE